jgi:hypothetical protein
VYQSNPGSATRLNSNGSTDQLSRRRVRQQGEMGIDQRIKYCAPVSTTSNGQYPKSGAGGGGREKRQKQPELACYYISHVNVSTSADRSIDSYFCDTNTPSLLYRILNLQRKELSILKRYFTFELFGLTPVGWFPNWSFEPHL